MNQNNEMQYFIHAATLRHPVGMLVSRMYMLAIHAQKYIRYSAAN